MSITATDTTEWLHAMSAATSEVFEGIFGSGACEVSESSGYNPTQKYGAFISLVGDTASLQIGISCSEADSKTLAGAFVGMEAEELDELEKDDIVDGLCEIINIVAGVAKSKMDNQVSIFKLGLPTMVEGQLRKPEGQDVAFAKGRIGPIYVELMVFCQAESK